MLPTLTPINLFSITMLNNSSLPRICILLGLLLFNTVNWLKSFFD